MMKNATRLFTSRHRHDLSGLETYVASLPATAGPAHAILGGWLLQSYRPAHRDAEAKRVRADLLARHPHDPEVLSLVQLADAQAHLARAANPLAAPDPADVAALRAVAASGTAAARVACPSARRFDPACPCRFPAPMAAKALATRANSLANGPEATLGTPYPNPARGLVRVPYALPPGVGAARLQVRNALGQVVAQLPLAGLAGEAQLDVRSLAAGLYHCVLVVKGRVGPARRLAVTN